MAERANATDVFYIELGTARTQKIAENKWLAMVDAHTALLGELQYYPRELIHTGSNKIVHIQAGLLEDKKSAKKLCRKLFAADLLCFIVEGLPPAYERKKKHKSASPLPWLQNEAHKQIDVKKELGGIISWVFGDDDDGEQKTKQAKAGASRVEVGEAIRVPLTAGNTRPTLRNYSEKTKLLNAGWLNIEVFKNQSAASKFWRRVRADVPKLAAGLRVLIVKPFSSKNKLQKALNIGPFASEVGAMSFCREGVEPLGSSYKCRFIKSGKKQTKIRRGKAKRIRNNNLGQVKTALYWLEVASASNKIKAARIWHKIMSTHDDLLAGMRGNVFASKRGGHYIVRIGPISTKTEATSLCSELKKRSVSCRMRSGQ